tara:strand:+ start:7360 stop:7704 length:345 start_codon:yes stop_codon:yes gene_type:complete
MLTFAHFAVQEYVSTPKYGDDTATYHDPVGPDEFAAYRLWAAEPKYREEFIRNLSSAEQDRLAQVAGFNGRGEFQVDYLHGRNALKIISQDEWEVSSHPHAPCPLPDWIRASGC